MANRISPRNIVNRHNPKRRTLDPAQSGAYHATLNKGHLLVTGIRRRIVFRPDYVLAARWMDEETILVVRSTKANSYEVIRGFKPRLLADFRTEPTYAEASVSPSGSLVALEFTAPHSMLIILPTGTVVQEPIAAINLGAPTLSVVWSEDSKSIEIEADEVRYSWQIGRFRFEKMKQ